MKMRGRPLVAVLALVCSACATWPDAVSPMLGANAASRSAVTPQPPVNHEVISSVASEVAITSDVPVFNDDPEHFVCVDGLRLDVSYSPDRQTARISTDRSSLISLRRVQQEGYLAYESGGAQFLREGPRAVFVNEATSISVKTGDTLTAIARRLYGDSARVRDIVSANPETLANPNLIYAGQILQLPHGRHLCRRART